MSWKLSTCSASRAVEAGNPAREGGVSRTGKCRKCSKSLLPHKPVKVTCSSLHLSYIRQSMSCGCTSAPALTISHHRAAVPGAGSPTCCSSRLLRPLQQHLAATSCRRSSTPFQSAKLRIRRSSVAAPGATGAAPITSPWLEGRDLQAKPQLKGDELLFYTHTLCPYAQRVHLALLEKVTRAESWTQ